MDINFSFDLPVFTNGDSISCKIEMCDTCYFIIRQFYMSYRKSLNSRGHITKDELRFLDSLEYFVVSCKRFGL